MTTREGASGRVRREAPLREHPVRTAASLFRAGGRRRAEPSAAEGFAERGVANAYGVLDEHLRRGRDAARAHPKNDHGRDTMNGDTQDIPRKLARAWADMLYVWMDMVGPLADRASGAARDRAGKRGPDPIWARDDGAWTEVPTGRHEPATAKTSTHGIDVEIASARPARVHLDLHRVTASHALAVHKLQRTDGAEAPSIVVTIEADSSGGAAVLRVNVPAEQPAGAYAALVFDRETGRPCGTVTLVLRD